MGVISISEKGAAGLTQKVERWSGTHFLIFIQTCQIFPLRSEQRHRSCREGAWTLSLKDTVATCGKVDDVRRVVSNDAFCIQVSALK